MNEKIVVIGQPYSTRRPADTLRRELAADAVFKKARLDSPAKLRSEILRLGVDELDKLASLVSNGEIAAIVVTTGELQNQVNFLEAVKRKLSRLNQIELPPTIDMTGPEPTTVSADMAEPNPKAMRYQKMVAAVKAALR